jgi:hypothetical protein
MRCPACNADNADNAERCAACGEKLSRRPRRRGLATERDAPLSPETEARERAALRAYRFSLFGLIPFVGLVLGPIALVLGGLARHRGKGDPSFRERGFATAAMVLGGLVTVTNWVGVALIILGLRGG